MAYNERTVKILSPDDTRTFKVCHPDYSRFNSFKETGREEVHTVEAYEKRVHGENIEPTRQFSTNSYTERRTYGRDENGEVVVKIDKNVSLLYSEWLGKGLAERSCETGIAS